MISGFRQAMGVRIVTCESPAFLVFAAILFDRFTGLVMAQMANIAFDAARAWSFL